MSSSPSSSSSTCPALAQHPTVSALVTAGLAKHTVFAERTLQPGEARTKIALLCFSSGTTGTPKAVAVPHFALLANVLQMRLAIGFAPRYVPGDVALAGASFWFFFGLCGVRD